MRRVAIVLAMALMLAGCESAASPTPEPTEAPTPMPTVAPWSLSVGGAQYGKRVLLGDDLTITLTVTNSGTAANELTRVQLDGLDDHFDLDSCVPDCENDGFLGSMFLDFPGVKPGGSGTIVINLVATKLGRSDWSMAVYDAEDGSDVFHGSGTTVVSG